MAKRAAQGAGSIRKRGTYWEARYTIGRDPETGKQVRKSVYGKTQAEVRRKLTQALADIDSGTYTDPVRMSFGAWLDIWLSEYCGGIKPRTLDLYQKSAKYRIYPFLGAYPLQNLSPVILQKYYNASLSGELDGIEAISAKTVHNIHGIIHKALNQAVSVGYLKSNPADMCILPKKEKKEMCVLNEAQTKEFLKAIEGDRFERLYLVALFTGMRQGELLGLTWDAVDFETGTIRVYQQVQSIKGKRTLVPPKNGKPRTIVPAAYVMELLKREKTAQAEKRLLAGPMWVAENCVFSDDLGNFLSARTIYGRFKKIAADIGCPNVRFHDLRHTYAVSALRAGIDVKTVSTNLGHATVAFTLDVYGHVTQEMQKDSAQKMQDYITSLKA